MTPLEKLAEGLLFGAPNKVIAVLFGYFDESGTDGQLGHTIISGFVAPLEEWVKFIPRWQAALDEDEVDEFHYSGCVQKERCYAGWDYPTQIRPHLDKMAKVICDHNLHGVSVAHKGDFKAVMAKHPDWLIRFPTAYHLCFEMLTNLLVNLVNRHWGKQTVIVMAKHPEYDSRTKEVFDVFKYNGQWRELLVMVQASPSVTKPLQAADMIAYETRRYQWKDDEEYWRQQPLLSEFLPLTTQGIRLIDGIGFDDEGLSTFLSQEKGQYLRTPPGFGGR